MRTRASTFFHLSSSEIASQRSTKLLRSKSSFTYSERLYDVPYHQNHRFPYKINVILITEKKNSSGSKIIKKKSDIWLVIVARCTAVVFSLVALANCELHSGVLVDFK